MVKTEDVSIAVSFIISYIQAVLYSAMCMLFVYTDDALLKFCTSTWIDVDDSDSCGYMTDDDYEITDMDNFSKNTYDIRSTLITMDNAPRDHVDRHGVCIMCAFVAKIHLCEDDGDEYIVHRLDTITNKVRCIVRLLGRLTLTDIQYITGVNIHSARGVYLIMVYKTSNGVLKQQIINTYTKKEILTGKDVLFGMIDW